VEDKNPSTLCMPWREPEGHKLDSTLNFIHDLSEDKNLEVVPCLLLLWALHLINKNLPCFKPHKVCWSGSPSHLHPGFGKLESTACRVICA
jgi:hypothetical protein